MGMRARIALFEQGRGASDRAEKLRHAGFLVFHKRDSASAKTVIKDHKLDLVLLDVDLPGGDGFSLFPKIRASFHGPILFITHRKSDADHIRGLRLGADDYLVQPIASDVLIARIETALRRTRISAQEVLRNGPLTLNLNNREVFINAKPFAATNREFEFLALMMKRKDEVVSREEIYRDLYNANYASFDRAVDVLASRVRRKLEHASNIPGWLKSVRGKGYLFFGARH